MIPAGGSSLATPLGTWRFVVAEPLKPKVMAYYVPAVDPEIAQNVWGAWASPEIVDWMAERIRAFDLDSKLLEPRETPK